ncbi:hypothetical protein [Methylomonas sp. MgM2]
MKLNKGSDWFLSAALCGILFCSALVSPSDAYARGGGRNISRSHVNNFNRGGANNFNRNVGVNRNQNLNVNRNVNANVNVNRNVNVHGGYYGGGGYYGRPYYGGVSTGAAVAIGLTGLAVGAMIGASQVPSSGCTTVMVRGIGYRQCGSTWLQPQYAGSQVNYVVVNSPY